MNLNRIGPVYLELIIYSGSLINLLNMTSDININLTPPGSYFNLKQHHRLIFRESSLSLSPLG